LLLGAACSFQSAILEITSQMYSKIFTYSSTFFPRISFSNGAIVGSCLIC
jgi:hypothetical protein